MRRHSATGLLRRAAFLGAVAAAIAACSSEPADVPKPGPGPEAPSIPAPTGAQRLTIAQYTNAIHDLFGEDVAVPTALEPDVSLDGFVAIGASASTVSSRGVEQYEDAAFAIAEQVTADQAHRARVVPCAPAKVDDADCAKAFIGALGRRAWRRPLTTAEVDRLGGIVVQAASALGSFDRGVEFGIAALLQSPHFLYRPTVGEPDPVSGLRRYTGWEMATRLSFFLWNSTPDDELLDAAELGVLTDDRGLAEQAQRMLASPRARQGLRNFVTEYLRLDELDDLAKDPVLFTYFSPEVGPAAREETLRGFEHLVFDADADYRDIFTTRTTFVNPKLASMYAVPAPTDEGFGQVELPEGSPRVGLLGQVSLLALYAHPTSSSATLRGKLVRSVLLCGEIPPPPVHVNTARPEPSGAALPLRARVKEHLENAECASCHLQMDPIGLGLENFDAIGRFREKDNGAVIDASGDLDGVHFADARELASAVRNHPALATCFVRHLYEYATSFKQAPDQQQTIEALSYDFKATGHRVRSLMLAIAMSPGFRLASDPQ